MKGNFKLKVSILLLFFSFCCLKPTWGQEAINCPNLSVEAIITNNNCQGSNIGAIQLKATGGTAPYTFQWDHKAGGANLSALPSGSYTVTVTDQEGCKAKKTFQVQDTKQIQLKADVTEPTMPSATDGEIVVTVSGGVAPFTFFIADYSNTTQIKRYTQSSEVIKGIGKGRYMIDVQDRTGCMATISLTVGK